MKKLVCLGQAPPDIIRTNGGAICPYCQSSCKRLWIARFTHVTRCLNPSCLAYYDQKFMKDLVYRRNRVEQAVENYQYMPRAVMLALVSSITGIEANILPGQERISIVVFRNTTHKLEMHLNISREIVPKQPAGYYFSYQFLT